MPSDAIGSDRIVRSVRRVKPVAVLASVIAMDYVFLGGTDRLSTHLFDTLQMRMLLVDIPVRLVS